jgi:hypothetical protein
LKRINSAARVYENPCQANKNIFEEVPILCISLPHDYEDLQGMKTLTDMEDNSEKESGVSDNGGMRRN